MGIRTRPERISDGGQVKLGRTPLVAATMLLVGFAASVSTPHALGQTGEVYSVEVSEVSPTPIPVGGTGTITAEVHVGDNSHDFGAFLVLEANSDGALTLLPMTGTPTCSTPPGLPPWISQCEFPGEPGDDFTFTIGVAIAADTPAGSTYEIRVILRNLSALGGPLLLHRSTTVVKVEGDAPGGRFSDDNGNVHEANIEAIAAADITRGCNPPTNDRYCPDDDLTRGQMAAFIRRAVGLPSTTIDYFSDDNDSVFEGDINALAAAGISQGCNWPSGDRFCPDDKVTRGEMAAFLRRAFDYPTSTTDYFTDDDGTLFEADINAIAAVGVTLGCNPPDNTDYCPDSLVKRDQMASFFARALGLHPIQPYF